jgi:uncharacterized protein
VFGGTFRRLNLCPEAGRLTDVALNQPLNQADLDALADFLDSDRAPDDSMDLCVLDGYLTAIAIGPVSLSPSQWFPRIWGEVEDPAFDSLEHAQLVFELIVRFYNQIARSFMEAPERFFPFLYEYVEDGERRVSVEDWCIGFSLGVHLRIEAWDPLIRDKEYSGLLAPIAAFSLEIAWSDVTKGNDPNEVRERLIALLPSAVQAIYAYWRPVREKRAHGLVSDSFHLGGNSKVRRNAPCPCGSGKKFKKCCGAAMRT